MTSHQLDRLNFWSKAITKYGISTVAFGLLAWWIHGQIEWGKEHLAAPLVRGHLEFLDTQTEAVKSIVTSNQQISETLKSLGKGQEDLGEINTKGFESMRVEHVKTRDSITAANAEQAKGREDAMKRVLEKIEGKP